MSDKVDHRPVTDVVPTDAFGIYDRVRLKGDIGFPDWKMPIGIEGTVVQLYADPQVERRGVFIIGVVWEGDPEPTRIGRHVPSDIEKAE